MLAPSRKLAKQEIELPSVRRMLSNSAGDYSEYTSAAKEYVRNVCDEHEVEEFQWMFQKPFSQGEHREQYYNAMFQLLNLLQALKLPANATIAEVGSGPGWLTEILASLGFQVECIEPCADMIATAKQRVESRLRHHHLLDQREFPVRFHCTTLEECELADESIDAFVFYESLHHIADEFRGLGKCFSALKCGGAIGITGESVWSPTNHQLRELCLDEMQRYGTLENPFSAEYLEYVLKEQGFESVSRYHSFNGFVLDSLGHTKVAELAQFPADSHQNVIARKAQRGHTTANAECDLIAARMAIHKHQWLSENELQLDLRLDNTGQATWLSEAANDHGVVTISLFNDGPLGLAEAMPRNRLSCNVAPGQSIMQSCRFTVMQQTTGWRVGLVNEGRFWFHSHGFETPLVRPRASM